MTELGFRSFDDLHHWSVQHPADFWRLVIARLGVVFDTPPAKIVTTEQNPRAVRWLPGARLNIVESCFQAAQDATAIVSGIEGTASLGVTTYAELGALVQQVGSGLERLGFAPGDRIALIMPMTVECVAAYLGIVRAGCVVVSIADSFSPEQIMQRLEAVGTSAVVTVDHHVRAGRRFDLYHTVLAARPPRTIVIPAGEQVAGELRDGDLAWAEFLGAAPGRGPVIADPGATTNILFSSGTTGTPKAIPWTHLTPLKGAMDGHFHQDIHPGDVVAWPTNIGWMMGPWLIYASLINRATMALYQGSPLGHGFARFVEQAGVTMLGVVPSLVRAWRNSGCTEQTDWSRVRLFSSTGEPSSAADYLWLMSRSLHRAPVIEYLGGTEIGGGHLTGTVVQPASPATFTTPALGIDFVILDEIGREVPEGGSGELFLKPPALGLSERLLGQEHDDVYYRGCPTGPDGEVLRRHGDQIARLPGGFFRALGRVDDTMNLGGIKVSSRELEQVLDRHPEVLETAAVGQRDEQQGFERLLVFAVIHGGRETEEDRLRRELQALVSTELNPLFKIHALHVVKELPRTASNKLMRRELRSSQELPS